MRHYLAFGLHIQSELALPELMEHNADGTPDVFIRFGEVRHPEKKLPTRGSTVVSNSDGAYMYWSQIGTFHVQGGSNIRIDPFRGVPEQTVRLPLLGVVLGTLLHQRGLFTLHASTVAIAGRAVAFLGWKGAGKSTIAAALHQKGHKLITDDVLALDFKRSAPAVVHVIPGYPQIKLYPSTTDALGSDPNTLSALHPELKKQALRPKDAFHDEQIPLGRIYSLDDGPEIISTALSKKDGLLQVLSHSYAARFLGDDGAGAEHFRQCTWLVTHVPIFRLERPRDLKKLDDLSKFVEDDVFEKQAV